MQPTPGTLINPRVRLLRPLSEGAMGTVWVGEHLTLHTEVAVKFISHELEKDDPQVLERFQREARAAAQIKSPNVVQMLDHGVTGDGTPYIVMELLEGESLADHLDRMGALGPPQAAMIVSQVARALAKAHSLGIVHRDIKPENIFLLDEDELSSEMDDQQVKVLDFGIAKHVEVPKEITVPGMIIGTPGYMCPDQVLDSRDVSPQTDCWSLAVVAYLMLTLELPFYGETMAKLVGALVRREYKPVSALRDELGVTFDAFFARAFAHAPEERFGGAIELAAAFREAAGIAPTGSGRWALPSVTGLTSRASMAGASPPAPPSAAAAPSRKEADVEDSAEGVSLAPPAEAGVGRASAKRLLPWALAGLGLAIGVGSVFALRGMMTGDGAPTAAPAASASPPAPLASGWIDIPSGSFEMGCNPATRSDCRGIAGPRTVTLDAFKISSSEITVQAYQQCANEDACTVDGLTIDAINCNWSQAGREQHPVNCVSWEQAQAYCTWAGGTLPTEAQWERAARGTDGRRYPWGDDVALCSRAVLTDEQGAGCGRQQTWRVGSHPEYASPGGALDMAGNVREWVADWWTPAPLGAPATNPTGPAAGVARVIRGGGYHDGPDDLRTYSRAHLAPNERRVDVGFRCVRRAE